MIAMWLRGRLYAVADIIQQQTVTHKKMDQLTSAQYGDKLFCEQARS